jgi:hypothetical protein
MASAGGGGAGGVVDGGVLVPLIGNEGEAQKGVHILPSDLPDEVGPKAEAQLEQILGVLQGEIAHPKYWMAVAVSLGLGVCCGFGDLCMFWGIRCRGRPNDTWATHS